MARCELTENKGFVRDHWGNGSNMLEMNRLQAPKFPQVDCGVILTEALGDDHKLSNHKNTASKPTKHGRFDISALGVLGLFKQGFENCVSFVGLCTHLRGGAGFVVSQEYLDDKHLSRYLGMAPLGFVA